SRYQATPAICSLSMIPRLARDRSRDADLPVLLGLHLRSVAEPWTAAKVVSQTIDLVLLPLRHPNSPKGSLRHGDLPDRPPRLRGRHSRSAVGRGAVVAWVHLRGRGMTVWDISAGRSLAASDLGSDEGGRR
ncbi:MAG: hypothetical protein ACHQNA_10370, partial [Acidimicrobiales bacterium]